MKIAHKKMSPHKFFQGRCGFTGSKEGPFPSEFLAIEGWLGRRSLHKRIEVVLLRNMDPFFRKKNLFFSQFFIEKRYFRIQKEKLSFFPFFPHFYSFKTKIPFFHNLGMNSLQVHQQKVHQPREKRLKVSRACITCRVKKIKVISLFVAMVTWN